MLFLVQELSMDYSNIHSQIEKLNLKWQEYDFGDTLYAEIPATLFSETTNIIANCETQKYKIRFQKNGYVLTFKEKNEVSLVEKMVKKLREINLSLSKEENDAYKSKKRFIDS